MDEHGVKPELEIFEPGFVGWQSKCSHKASCMLRFTSTCSWVPAGSVPAEMRDLVYLVDSLPHGSTWSAAGIGRYQVGVNVAAILMGGHVRVGLEDALHYDPQRNSPGHQRAAGQEDRDDRGRAGPRAGFAGGGAGDARPGKRPPLRVRRWRNAIVDI